MITLPLFQLDPSQSVASSCHVLLKRLGPMRPRHATASGSDPDTRNPAYPRAATDAAQACRLSYGQAADSWRRPSVGAGGRSIPPAGFAYISGVVPSGTKPVVVQVVLPCGRARFESAK
jgi:hypothetical protein